MRKVIVTAFRIFNIHPLVRTINSTVAESTKLYCGYLTFLEGRQVGSPTTRVGLKSYIRYRAGGGLKGFEHVDVAVTDGIH